MNPLLSLDFSVHIDKKPILQSVVLDVYDGQAVGIVGQSGAGKSTLALSILGLLDRRRSKVTGSIRFREREMVGASERDLRLIRGNQIALVLQSASSALNPALRLETQLREAWGAHSKIPWSVQRSQTLGTLDRFSLPSTGEFLRRFPREISVGQAQRVLIAMALLHRPALLVADEPTSALDPQTARDVLEALRIANQECKTALIYITHNLATVPKLCQSVAVIRAGEIVQQGACADVLAGLEQEHTETMRGCFPTQHGANTKSSLDVCRGLV